MHARNLLLPAIALLGTLHGPQATAQTPPCTGPFPDHVYGTYGMDLVNNAAVAPDGNVFVVGSVSAEGGNIGADRYGGRDAVVLKLEPDGDLIWSAILGGPLDDALYGILPLADGGCIATGNKGDQGWYLRILPSGSWIWESAPSFTERVGIFEQASPTTVLLTNGWIIDIAGGLVSTGNLPPHPDVLFGPRRRSPDGGFIAARTLYSFDVTGIWSAYPTYLGSGEDIGLVKTDASGALLWAKRFNSVSIDDLAGFLVLPDGYLLLSSSYGFIPGGDRLSTIHGLHDFWMIRTDLDGNIVWERSYGSTQDDIPKGMFQDTDGNFVLYGRTEAINDHDVTEPVRSATGIGLDGWMLKIDGSGNKLWDKRWGGGGADWLFAGAPVPGGYLMVGTTDSDPGYDRTAPRLNSTDLWVMRMLPGTPTTWYNDADADGFGDPASPITACTRPFGYAANGLDCDPLAPNPTSNYIGARCDDGNTFTFPDRITAGCTCSGAIPDFLFDHLTFELLPDAFAGTLSMSVFPEGSATPIMSFGPWPSAQPGVPVVEAFDLPPGRYTLRVFDAMADGITDGGYTLRVNGERIVDADGAFQQASEAPIGFELPVGERCLTTATCDKLDLLPASSIVASPDPLVTEHYGSSDATTGYQFWIFNPHGGYSRRVFQSHANPGPGQPPGPTACAHLKLSSLVNNPVPQLTRLNVRVRSRIDGSYAPFGPACTIMVDPYAGACPTTQLVDQPGSPNFSCGSQKSFGGSNKVVAFAVAGANKYQFEFAEPGLNYLRRITSTNNARLLNWGTLQPLCGTFTYQVRVRASFDQGQTWCPWGATCPVTIAHYAPGCTPVGSSLGDPAPRSLLGNTPRMDVFPNPASSSTLHVAISGLAEEERVRSVRLTDAGGRMVLERTVTSEEGTTDLALDVAALEQGAYVLAAITTHRTLTGRAMVAR